MRRRLIFIVYGFVLAIFVILVLGPREPMSGSITFDRTTLTVDLDQYLSEQESRFSDIREGLQKEIIWADPEKKEKTELSVIYIHGYSASKEEIRPVPDEVAQHFGANLFLTRMRGHGRTADAMADAYVDDWLNDMAEALAIGERLGDKVVVIATSNGGSVATWFAANYPEWTRNVAGYIMVSPNYGLAFTGSNILSLPFARTFVPLLMGEYRVPKRGSPTEEHAWTTPHHTASLMPMAKITAEAAEADVSQIQTPALFVYSLKDTVVRPEMTEEIATSWGGSAKRFLVEQSSEENHHVIAGKIRSPETTDAVVKAIIHWLSDLVSN